MARMHSSGDRPLDWRPRSTAPTLPAESTCAGFVATRNCSQSVRNTGRSSQPVVVPNEPESPRQVATTYRNPFATPRTAALKLAPPVALPSPSGPISRWQRPTAYSTILRLSVPPSSTPRPTNLVHLPSSPLTRSDGARRHEFREPPDPIQFAPQVTRPTGLAVGRIRYGSPTSRTRVARLTVDPISVDAFNLPLALISAPGQRCRRHPKTPKLRPSIASAGKP